MISIIQRKKDVAGMKWNNRCIKDYYVFSMEQLERNMPEIIKLCNLFNARAYIRLSRRDTREIAKDMIVEIGEAFKNNSFNHLKKIYSTVVGRNKWLDKLWIVDIDFDDVDLIVPKVVDVICNCMPLWNKIISLIPTKNGAHLITKPFNKKQFKDVYPGIDLHDNNPTVLYYPEPKDAN